VITDFEGHRHGEPVRFEIEDIGNGMSLEVGAARAFVAMAAAARADGLVLRVNTALRTHEHQARLYARFCEETAYFRDGKRTTKPSLVARPGYSTHESGLSVDINRAHDDTTDNGIADGKTDLWLAANAGRFGFVRDVKSEPWHWTFTGAPEAVA
jgi:D-alanyl-D-alanine carboxypeptidase